MAHHSPIGKPTSMSKGALLIKLSSMGDLMHARPASTDADNRAPNIEFDWLVDKTFTDVPSWHPAVMGSVNVVNGQSFNLCR